MIRRSFEGWILLVLLAAEAAWAAGPAVNRVKDFAERVTTINKIAVLPIELCPAALDCPEAERRLYVEVRAVWQVPVVPASLVRQKLFDRGITAVDTELKAALVQELGVKAFLVPAIPYMGSKEEGATYFTPAGDAPEARVELALIPVDGELPLFRGTNQGQATTLNQPETLTTRLFKGILTKAFPRSERK